MPNLLNPLLAGQDLTSTFFNATIDNARSLKYQTTNIVRNNTTTFLDSTDLVIALVANGVYQFDSCFFYDSSTTADIKVRLTFPTGTAALIAPWGSTNVANTGTTNSMDQQGSVPASDVITWSFNGANVGTTMAVRPAGWINVSTTAANLVVGFTQNTANATNTTLSKGSWIALTRVG
jgi:hypothetical protein